MSLLFQFVFLAFLSCLSLIRAEQKYFSVEGVKKCFSKSPELNNCVKDNANIIWPSLIKGSKEFNLPLLDPFKMKDIEFSYTGSILSGILKAENIIVAGLADLKIDTIEINNVNKTVYLQASLYAPKLNVNGNYSGAVGMTLFSLKPKGGFNVLLNDLYLDVSAEAEISSKDGHSFGKVTQVYIEPTPKKFRLDVEELVVEPLLTKTVIDLVNESWRIYYAAVMPQTRKYWQPYIVELVNNLLNVAPLDNLIDL